MRKSFLERLQLKNIGNRTPTAALDGIFRSLDEAKDPVLGDAPLPPTIISTKDYIRPNILTAIVSAYLYGDFRYFQYHEDGRPRTKPLEFKTRECSGSFELTRFRKDETGRKTD